MASNDGEPCAKSARLEEAGSSIRYLKLDMAKYHSSYQKYSDDDLVKLFELGLRVKESASLSLDVNQKFVEDALNSQMKVIQESVTRIEQNVNAQVQTVQEKVTQVVGSQMQTVQKNVQEAQANVSSNVKNFTGNVEDLKKDVSKQMATIQDQLTSRVDTVAQKVPPLNTLDVRISDSARSVTTQLQKDVKDSETRVSKKLEECNQKLDSISSSLQTPSNKGARAERNVLDILRQHLDGLNFTFLETARDRGKGDIEVQTPNGQKVMIEVMQRTNAVSRDKIEEFERNLANSPDYKVGILLSMTSGIAMRSKGTRFEIAFDQSKKQYQIYVPDAYANNEEHLIVWSVVMADQLVKLDGELGERKTKGLDEIYKKFAANIEHKKLCEASLASLESSMKNLKDNIQPILKTVDETKNAIYKLLHSS